MEKKTPKELAHELGVDQKVVRRHLRELFPGNNRQHWELDPDQVEKRRARIQKKSK